MNRIRMNVKNGDGSGGLIVWSGALSLGMKQCILQAPMPLLLKAISPTKVTITMIWIGANHG